MILKIAIPKLKTIERSLGRFKDQAPAVMSRAINSTLRRTQTDISKTAQKHYIVKAAGVKKTLSVQKAKKSSLYGEVRSRSDERIKLISFPVSPKEPLAAVDFYQAQVKKRMELKNLKGSGDRSRAFVARMKSGHIGVFERMIGQERKHGKRKNRPWWAKGARDEKLAEVTGPAVPTLLRDAEVVKVIQEDAVSYLRKQVDKEIERILGG